MKSEVKCLQNYMMAFELTAASENRLFYREKKKNTKKRLPSLSKEAKAIRECIPYEKKKGFI